MNTAVDRIVRQIEKLTLRQRRALERRLAMQRDQEWEDQCDQMRKIAKARGITQEMIDKAVMEVRYGK